MLHAVLADLVMLIHAAFVVFVAVGGFLAAWKLKVAWAHVPCALYGAAIEFFGWVCPLTPLEVDLRRAAGQEGYAGGFIQHYVGNLLYPGNWGDIHLWLGVAVVVGNGAIYAWIWTRRRRHGGASGAAG